LRSPALEPHWDVHGQRGAVEPSLNALHHAACLSSCCRNSPIRLMSPSALIRTLRAVSWTSTRSNEEQGDPRLLGGEQLVPGGGEVGEQHRNLAFGDLILVLALGRCPGPSNQLRDRQQLLTWASTAPSTSAAGTLVTAQPLYPDTSAQLGSPAGSFAMKAAQRRVKSATSLRSSSSASRTRRAASARPVCISTSASTTARWAHAGQQQWRPEGAGRPADARTHVDFIDFSPGALAQFVDMRAGRFNPMAITGLQPGDEKRPLAFAYAGAALAASSETQARSPKRSVDEG
jgi:hypothetical protein